MSQARSIQPVTPSKPWWRYGIVWLVVGGPAVVVVAAVATAVIAVKTADELVVDPAVAKGEVRLPAAEQPAVQGRNHAATPDKP